MTFSMRGFDTGAAGPAGRVRPAAVAGMFYPADPDDLRRALQRYLAEVPAPAADAPAPKALITPHAGYVYSGPVAARAYARLTPRAARIRRVVLLGPVHRVAVRGLALPAADRFDTPLGAVEIDRAAIAQLADLPQVVVSDRAHAPEHSLEVQLPFLQQVLSRFALVPLAVGEACADEVAAVLARLWGGSETLVVVSSDLSHYLPYASAQAVDRATVEALLALDATLDHAQACGATPLNGLLAFARRRGLRAELLDLRNSGDTAGDRERVVGYAALALYEPASAHGLRGDEGAAQSASRSGSRLDAQADALVQAQAHPQSDACANVASAGRGPTLLAHARAAIAHRLGLQAAQAPRAHFLDAPGASFVTLKIARELRGCIGSLHAHRPLGADVRANAQAAAFDDPRFAPLAPHEYAALAVEVSVLSPSTPMTVASERELHAQLRPGIDGLTLQWGGRRGTFLPQVWDSLPEPREFVAQLKRKAGLAPDFWSSELAVSRYTVEKFSEERVA